VGCHKERDFVVYTGNVLSSAFCQLTSLQGVTGTRTTPHYFTLVLGLHGFGRGWGGLNLQKNTPNAIIDWMLILLHIREFMGSDLVYSNNLP
jgi:hypothetical protein